VDCACASFRRLNFHLNFYLHFIEQRYTKYTVTANVKTQHTNTFRIICQLTCTSHYRMHEAMGIGMRLCYRDGVGMVVRCMGMEKIYSGWSRNGANFY